VNVLIVTGIWPPDVGGPASHAPDVADFLHARGHRVAVVTTAAASPAPRAYPVRWLPRSIPKGLLHLRTAAEIGRLARTSDVVYTTGMFGRSAAGATLARRPFVVKLTADPAFERARRRGGVHGTVDDFQRGELVLSWGVPAERVSVLPNAAPNVERLGPRAELRRSLGLNGATLAFAGRLTVQKSLEVALEALARTQGVELVVAGEGGERARLERLAAERGLSERVRFLGAQPRERVLELLRAADASILSSSWENFPHSVVEALAVGTPVLATATGGVAEVVSDGVNGLLVPVGDAAALGSAIDGFFGDEALRERLRAAAAPSVADYAPERVLERLEQVLERTARR
jgi:glycosyltransferase involved in cell wall biosynthesis